MKKKFLTLKSQFLKKIGQIIIQPVLITKLTILAANNSIN